MCRNATCSVNAPDRDLSVRIFLFFFFEIGSAAAHNRPGEKGFGLLHRDGESFGQREAEPGSKRVQK